MSSRLSRALGILKKHGLRVLLKRVVTYLFYRTSEAHRQAVALISKWRIKSEAEKVGEDLTVNGPSNVTANTNLGDNVNFNGMVITGSGRVDIGDNLHSGVQCRIITTNHKYENADWIPYGYGAIEKEVEIQENVWLGDRVLILPGVTIQEGAIVQAGSTVTQDIPKGAIAGGHPAEVFDYRDMEHYEDLKSRGKVR